MTVTRQTATLQPSTHWKSIKSSSLTEFQAYTGSLLHPYTHAGTWMKGFKRRAYSETNSYFPILGRQHATIRAGLLYLDDYDWGMIHQCQGIRREIVSISILSCFITAILAIQSNARSGTQQAKTIARLHPSWLLLIFYIFLSSCFKTVHFVFYG